MLHDKTISSKQNLGLKEQKVQVLPPFGKFITEVLFFAEANTFFQLNLLFIADNAPIFVLDSFKNTS